MTDPRELLDSSEDIIQAATQTLVSAARSIVIYSQELPTAIYENDKVLDGLVSLANATRHATVRVIVLRPRIATSNAPRFIDLCRRLQSTLELRALREDAGHHEETFMVADERDVVYQPTQTRWEATYAKDAPHIARRYLNSFDNMWEHSEPNIEFRRLSL